MKQRAKQKVRSRWLSVIVLIFAASSMLHAMALQMHVYTVTDSVQSIQIRTLTDDPEGAVALAGYDTEAYAIIRDSGDDNLVRTLTIEKTFPVRVTAEGARDVVWAVSGNVEDILMQYGLTLADTDETVPARDVRLTFRDEMQDIAVTRVSYETEVIQKPIAFETVKRTTSALDFGQTQTVQEGAEGVLAQTFRYTLRDGVRTAEELVEEHVVQEPQTEIIESGTGGAVVTRGGDTLRYSAVYDMRATAYSSSDGGTRTAMGTRTRVGAVAVDPRVIPLGSRLYITSADGTSWVYGTAVAEDTGGAIKGNKVDLFFNTSSECTNFGVRQAKVYVLS